MTGNASSGKIWNIDSLEKKLLILFLTSLWLGSRPVPVEAPPPPRPAIQQIVVDAGHGGKDSGAVYPSGLLEKELTLDVAQRVQSQLQAKGVRVVMTRDADVFIPLPNRSKIANKKKADLFVSIHANASPNKEMKGFEVYYLSEASGRLEGPVLELQGVPERFVDTRLRSILWLLKEAKNRAESALLAHWIGDRVGRSLPVDGQRIKAANFYVLKNTECPAVLIEMGYGSNHQDENKLRSPYYRRRLAEAIVNGVLDYARQYEKTKGFTDGRILG